MKKVTITLRGKDDDAILVGLYEVSRVIQKGFGAGMDSSEDGSYQFDSEEEEEEDD